MIEIFCQSDLDKFRKESTYPAVFSDLLQSRFDELKTALGEDFEEDCEFNLRESGHIVILQKCDDLRDLGQVGMNKEENGLFGDVPEEVSLIEAPGFSVYTIQTAFNNSFMMEFFLPKGEFEAVYPEFGDYLKRWLHGRRKFCPRV